MSEYKQEHINRVSLEEYDASRLWRAEAEELSESLRRSSEDEDQARGRFTMRLLEKDQSGARDQLVEVVGADGLASNDLGGALSVTVRTVLKGDAEKGRLKTCLVAADGIILNSTTDTLNFENGYFVGGEGVGEDELQDFAMELLVPRQEQALKAMELPLE